MTFRRVLGKTSKALNTTVGSAMDDPITKSISKVVAGRDEGTLQGDQSLLCLPYRSNKVAGSYMGRSSWTTRGVVGVFGGFLDIFRLMASYQSDERMMIVLFLA